MTRQKHADESLSPIEVTAAEWQCWMDETAAYEPTGSTPDEAQAEARRQGHDLPF